MTMRHEKQIRALRQGEEGQCGLLSIVQLSASPYRSQHSHANRRFWWQRIAALDEPVAGMTSSEIDRTAEMLRSLSVNRAILVVEHDMEFVRKIADQITVMDQGSVIAEGDMDQIQSDSRVREVYLGDEKLSF